MAAGLLGLPAVLADVIYLKNGRVITSERAWVEGAVVKYQTPDGVKSVDRPQVDEVVSQDNRPARFRRAEAEEKPPETPAAAESAAPARPPKPTLLKGVPKDSTREVSGSIIAQLKKNLAEDPKNAQRRGELVAALNMRAGFLLLSGEADEALKACQEALTLSPSEAKTLTLMAVVQIEKAAYRDAEETLRRAESLGARSQVVYYLLGEAYYAQDKVSAAVAEWRRALAVAPDKDIQQRLEKALAEVKTHEGLEKSATRHFILRYDKQVADARLGQEVLDFLEQGYRQLTGTLLDTPPETITVILYGDQAYFDITRSPAWSGGVYDGKIRLPVKGVRALDESMRSALNHELTHAFIALATGDRCPAWFHEGVAQMIEGRRARQYDKLLADARRQKKLIPLEQLGKPFTAMTAPQAELAYAQSLAAVEYLQKVAGPAAVREVIRRVRVKRNFSESLGEVARLGPKDFEKAWLSALAEGQ